MFCQCQVAEFVSQAKGKHFLFPLFDFLSFFTVTRRLGNIFFCSKLNNRKFWMTQGFWKKDRFPRFFKIFLFAEIDFFSCPVLCYSKIWFWFWFKKTDLNKQNDKWQTSANQYTKRGQIGQTKSKRPPDQHQMTVEDDSSA